MTIEEELEALAAEIPKEEWDKLKTIPDLRIHIIPLKGWWRLKREGAVVAFDSFLDRQDALKAGVGYLVTRDGGEMVVHAADGTVKEVWELAKR